MIRRGVEPLAAHATIATIGIAVSMAASVISIGAALARRRELVRVRDGQFVSDHRLEQVDDWVRVAAVIVLLGSSPAPPVSSRGSIAAYKNLSTWHATRFRSGWAIGGWFVPFLNLVRPYQIAKELASYSGPNETAPTNALPLWWALVIIGGHRQPVHLQLQPQERSTSSSPSTR